MKKTLIYTIIIGLFLLFISPYSARAQTESFSFTAVGDYGSDSGTATNRNNVLKGIGAANVDFHIGLGDYLYSNTLSLIPSWCQNTKNMINAGAGKPDGDPYGENFPFQLVIGNHDSGESNADTVTIANSLRDCLPNRMNNIVQGQQINGSAYGIEYYYDYPTSGSPLARFILIAPDITGGNFNGWDYTRNSTHYNFLRNAVLSARTANIPWIVVGMHKNCISNGVKGCEIGTELFNLLTGKDLDPSVNYPSTVGYGQAVDLILQGHEHTYHRSKSLKTNATTCSSFQAGAYNASCVGSHGPTNFTKSQGSIMAIVGTGGVALRSLTTSSDPETPYFNAWVGSNESYPTPGQQGTWGLLKVTVTRNQLHGQFIPRSGGGSFTDSFTIASANTTVTPTALPTIAASPTPSCPQLPTNTGSVISTISLTNAGTYRVWSRMKNAGDAANSYWLQVDNQCAINVNDLNGSDNSDWQWIDYQKGDTSLKNNLILASGTHTLRMVGKEANVKIDKVVVTLDQQCIPTSISGDECLGIISPTIPQTTPIPTSTPLPSDTIPPIVMITYPSDGTSVTKNSTVLITANATDNTAVTRIDFYVSGSLKCTDLVAPYSCSWKVGGKSGATYTLQAVAYDGANNSASSSVTITSDATAVRQKP